MQKEFCFRIFAHSVVFPVLTLTVRFCNTGKFILLLVNIINYLLQNCQRWQIGIFADSKSFFFFHQKVGVAWYFTPFFNSKQITKDDKVVYVTEECLPFVSNLQNSANMFFLHFRTNFFSVPEFTVSCTINFRYDLLCCNWFTIVICTF